MNSWIFLLVTAVSPAAAGEPLTRAELLAHARPSPGLLAAEAALAEAEAALAETTPRLNGGPTAELTAGPRRDESSTRLDFAVELDFPLWKGGEARHELRQALAAAARTWRAEARALHLAELARAHLDVWLAQERLVLLRDEQLILERWLEVARRRVEAGADPPYEAALVEAELSAARFELARAEAERKHVWGKLLAQADLPNEPRPVEPPAEPTAAGADELRRRFVLGLLAQAPAARALVTEKLSAFELKRHAARWSLQTALAREGEEHVARGGVGLRWFLADELPARERQIESTITKTRREAEVETAEFAARLEAALTLRHQLDAGPPPPEVGSALAALELRLIEGKTQPSQALPLIRQFLHVRSSALEREKARFELAIELSLLTEGVSP